QKMLLAAERLSRREINDGQISSRYPEDFHGQFCPMDCCCVSHLTAFLGYSIQKNICLCPALPRRAGVPSAGDPSGHQAECLYVASISAPARHPAKTGPTHSRNRIEPPFAWPVGDFAWNLRARWCSPRKGIARRFARGAAFGCRRGGNLDIESNPGQTRSRRAESFCGR